MKKRIFNLILLLIVLLPFNIYADNRLINGNDYTVYQKSKENITAKWQVGKLDIPDNIFDIAPSYTSPYSAGVVKQSYLNDVVDNLNYYRYLIGVPEVAEYPENDSILQTAEVVQDVSLNSGNYLTHYLRDVFNKPADMDQAFYDTGVDAYHNIIAYGMPSEPNFFFFDESVYDEYNPTAGHRMALLGPEMSQIEYGLGRTVVYGRIHYDKNNYNEMENDFAAYPAPGNFPKQDFADISDWDVFLNINKFKILNSTEEENVIVTIRNLTTNEIETRSITSGDLEFDYYCIGNTCQPYYRLHILQPTKLTPYYEDDYEVYITNLIDNFGNPVDIKYTVNFYDKFEGIESSIYDIIYDLNLSRMYIDGEYDENFIKAFLEDIGAYIVLESGAVISTKISDFNASYIGNYNDNSISYKFVPKNLELPSWAIDTNNVIQNSYIQTFNYQNSSDYRYAYADLSYTKNVGNAVTMLIEDYYPHYDGTAIYTWIKEKDGILYELTDENKYSTGGLYLTIKNLTKEDEGNYYLATVLLVDGYSTRIYISKPLALTIHNPAKGISIDDKQVTINVGNTYQVIAKTNPIDSDTIITYESSDESVATVDENGNVMAIKAGVVTITAKAGIYSATTEITITNHVQGDLNNNGKIDLQDIIYLLKRYNFHKLTKMNQVQVQEQTIMNLKD